MKDVSLALRIAIVQKIRNNVTCNGAVVRVFGKKAPTSANGTYIYIPTQSSRNGSSKQYDSTDQTVVVEVVYRAIDDTDSDPLDDMCNQVMQILSVHNQKDMPQPEGLEMVDFDFVSSNELDDFDGVYMVYRRLLTFEAIVDG